MKESCTKEGGAFHNVSHTNWVMSHIKELCLTWMSHVPYEGVMYQRRRHFSQCISYELSHVSYKGAMSHMSGIPAERGVNRTMSPIKWALKGVISHMNWVMSHVNWVLLHMNRVMSPVIWVVSDVHEWYTCRTRRLSREVSDSAWFSRSSSIRTCISFELSHVSNGWVMSHMKWVMSRMSESCLIWNKSWLCLVRPRME